LGFLYFQLTRIGCYQQLLQCNTTEQQQTNHYFDPRTAKCSVKRNIDLHDTTEYAEHVVDSFQPITTAES
jgi:hypothetical protein